MDEPLEQYDLAWNTSAVDERHRLLAGAFVSDCELIEPGGRFVGTHAISERIGGFADRFPGARVAITTGVDEHHGFARYGWTIVDRQGTELLTGIDIVERADDGRLRRVLMFFGPLTSRDEHSP